ncbi:MAG: Y4bD/Y4pK family protein [Anaerolineae bacterium]|nr:Y4bD/Y4pK family protein [Anaerolineae bacterium]
MPNPSDEGHEFTVTHPFHPLKGQTFAILARRSAWGEPRVQFLDPAIEQVRSLPIAAIHIKSRQLEFEKIILHWS